MPGKKPLDEKSTVPAEWWADETFWSVSYPFMFSEERFQTAVEQVDKIVELTGVRSGAVLDQCCGPGRHAVPLAKRGFSVTAVDRTDYLLEKGRAYAEREGVDVEFVSEDMRRFVRPQAYDLALNLFTSFGFFDDPIENQRVLENVYASLGSGGAFVLDTVGKENVARIFEPVAVNEIGDDLLLIERRRLIDSWSRIENEWTFIQGGAVRKVRLRLWLYSARELETLLADAGFAAVDFYGDIDGAPYDHEAKRLIVVARKS